MNRTFLPPSSSSAIERRSFIKGLTALSLGLVCGVNEVSAAPVVYRRRRYTLVGAEECIQFYRQAIQGPLSSVAEEVGQLHLSDGTLNAFEKRLHKTQTDAVIVAPSCETGCALIRRALQAGCDVITELSPGSTFEAWASVHDTYARTGRTIRLALPQRYVPAHAEVKILLAGGRVGKLLSVDFIHARPPRPLADKGTSEGPNLEAWASFDLINWWVGSAPLRLCLNGRAYSHGFDSRRPRLLYRDGVTLSYSEKNSTGVPCYFVAFNGTQGRLEHSWTSRVHGAGGSALGAFSRSSPESKTRLFPLRGPAREVVAPSEEGQSGEEQMLADLFSAEIQPERRARALGGVESATWALAVGRGLRETRGEGRDLEASLFSFA